MEKIKVPCPYCKGEKNCNTVGYKKREWRDSDADNYFWAEEEYMLLECLGCEGVFTYIKSSSSEDYEIKRNAEGYDYMEPNYHISIYPEQEKARPIWFNKILNKDYQLYKIMDEMYIAFQNKSFILAAIGLRTIFDRATEVLEIDPGHTFGDKVHALEENGLIGAVEAQHLKVVTEAGNSAAHRAWSPSEDEFKSLLDIIETLVIRTILKDDNIYEISEKLPKKPPKPKKNLN